MASPPPTTPAPTTTKPSPHGKESSSLTPLASQFYPTQPTGWSKLPRSAEVSDSDADDLGWPPRLYFNFLRSDPVDTSSFGVRSGFEALLPVERAPTSVSDSSTTQIRPATIVSGASASGLGGDRPPHRHQRRRQAELVHGLPIRGTEGRATLYGGDVARLSVAARAGITANLSTASRMKVHLGP
jgi:hypothetical protein